MIHLAYLDELLRRIELQKEGVYRFIGTADDQEAHSMLKNLRQSFDDERDRLAETAELQIDMEAETCLVKAGEFEVFIEDFEAPEVFNDLYEGVRKLTGNDLNWFGLDNDWIIDNIQHAIEIAHTGEQPVVTGNSKNLALLAFEANYYGTQWLTTVREFSFDEETGKRDYVDIPFSEARPEKQIQSLISSEKNILEASEYLLRAEQVSMARHILLNSLREGRNAKAQQVSEVVDQMTKAKISERARRAANKRHERTNNFKSMALDLYESGNFRSQAAAARAIANHLRLWADENGVHPLSEMNEVELIKKWIREYRKQLKAQNSEVLLHA